MIFQNELKHVIKQAITDLGLDILDSNEKENILNGSIKSTLESIMDNELKSVETEISLEWCEIINIGKGKSSQFYDFRGSFNQFIDTYSTIGWHTKTLIAKCMVVYLSTQSYGGDAVFDFTTGNESGNHTKFKLTIHSEGK